MTLTHGSLFAGINGDKGFEEVGFQCRWAVEIEPFCQAVIRTHYPALAIFNDIRECGSHNLEPVDVITAGVPCQDVSVAGKRAGLAAERTGLFYDFARILRELRPTWFVFENVPGILSSNRGRDFAEVLRVLMVECGYGVSWRVLDSQFFGVAQRRRRVFVVGCCGKPCPPKILFESESGDRNPAKGGEARPYVAAPLTSGSGVTSNAPGRRREDDENLAYCLREDPGGIGQGHNTTYAVTENMRNRSQGPANYVAGPITASYGKQIDSSDRNGGPPNIVATINSGGNSGGFRTEPGEHLAVAFAENMRGEIQLSEVHQSLSVGGGKPGQGYPAAICAQADAYRVRDFAGLPEGLDSARYRALGNAWTVQVGRCIANRILASCIAQA